MAAPAMTPVYSSHVEAIGYAPESGDLHVRYRGGRLGIYAGVPQEVAKEVVESASIGQALHRLVRNVYEFRYEEGEQDG